MFEDSKKEIEAMQQTMLREFLSILAPPSQSAYGVYARSVLRSNIKNLDGQRKAIERVGPDAFGPEDMDVSAIAGLLVERGLQERRNELQIPKLSGRVIQELHNIRNDRNDLQAHVGVSTDLSSLGASYVIAEHLMRFTLAVSKERPQVQGADSLTDYCDYWFAVIRSFLNRLEEALLDYEAAMEPERRARQLLALVMSKTGEERINEYNLVWIELRKEMARTKDQYGRERSESEQVEGKRCFVSFELKAAEAGITEACKHVRSSAVFGGEPYFRRADYATRASTLLRLSRKDGLTGEEKLWLAGVYKNGLLPTHSPKEGDLMLRECREELKDSGCIASFEEEGYTFYRVARKTNATSKTPPMHHENDG